ncbi:MAG TPA: CPBP family intramembrane glutamic endopeptidase [Candidatus Angelobacter sp.]|nr:CPBP family intramembrane glutamic endopeptidase [Candidatus Angelobacter sp.]
MSTTAVGNLSSRSGNKRTGALLLGAYLALYAVSLFLMTRFGGFEAGEALGVFLVLGVGFSLIAWLLTLGVKPLPYSVRQPGSEEATLLLYLLPLAAFIAYGFGTIHRLVPAEPADSLAILAAKLAVFVVIPGYILVARFGYGVRQLAPVAARMSDLLVFLGMAAMLIAFQSVLGRGFRDIADAHVSAGTLVFGMPFVYLWLVVEVGVVEEFFFRVLLQSRLSAALRSELGGIVLASLLFGLVHAPGLYLRTGVTQEGLSAHPSLAMAIGYSIVITSVAGFFLGVLWSRTRNFLVLVLVHAAADLLPNTLPTLRAFHLLR